MECFEKSNQIPRTKSDLILKVKVFSVKKKINELLLLLQDFGRGLYIVAIKFLREKIKPVYRVPWSCVSDEKY